MPAKERRRAELTDFSTQYPMSGVTLIKGPVNPHRVAPSERPRQNYRTKITSKLGRECERALTQDLTEKLDGKKKAELVHAINAVVERLHPITQKTYNKHAELASFYQALTKPAEIPLMGNERVLPEFEPLAHVFTVVDEIFETRFCRQFQELGEDSVKQDQLPSEFRYLVEGALVMAKLATEPPLLPQGQFIPNVKFRSKDGKMITQFDEIILQKGVPLEVERIKDHPWAVVEVKLPLRARYVSGKNKISKHFTRDVRPFQQQLANIISSQDKGHFNFPTYLKLIYLRGTQEHRIHNVPLNYWFFHVWGDIIDRKLEANFFENDALLPTKHLLSVVREAEKDALERERRTKTDIPIGLLTATQTEMFSTVENDQFSGTKVALEVLAPELEKKVKFR